jgi:hypothetical protein
MTGTTFKNARAEPLQEVASECTRRFGRPVVTWLYSVEEDVKIMGIKIGEENRTGSGPMERNRKRGQGSPRAVEHAEEQEEEESNTDAGRRLNQSRASCEPGATTYSSLRNI